MKMEFRSVWQTRLDASPIATRTANRLDWVWGMSGLMFGDAIMAIVFTLENPEIAVTISKSVPRTFTRQRWHADCLFSRFYSTVGMGWIDGGLDYNQDHPKHNSPRKAGIWSLGYIIIEGCVRGATMSIQFPFTRTAIGTAWSTRLVVVSIHGGLPARPRCPGQYKNSVCIFDRGESMGNGDCSATTGGLSDRCLNQFFRLSIKCRSCLVEQQHFGLANKCSCN